jgi:hypothetical protein
VTTLQFPKLLRGQTPALHQIYSCFGGADSISVEP